MTNLFFKFKRIFLKDRIIETRGVFIPQVYTVKGWRAVFPSRIYWSESMPDIANSCGRKTYDEANNIIQNFNDELKSEKKCLTKCKFIA